MASNTTPPDQIRPLKSGADQRDLHDRRQISTREGKEIVCIPFQLKPGNRDTATTTVLSPTTNHLSQGKAAWVLVTADVQDVSPVASLPYPSSSRSL
ncbi:hypothetical protein AAC387_Pa06g1564 [Persea americana]